MLTFLLFSFSDPLRRAHSYLKTELFTNVRETYIFLLREFKCPNIVAPATTCADFQRAALVRALSHLNLLQYMPPQTPEDGTENWKHSMGHLFFLARMLPSLSGDCRDSCDHLGRLRRGLLGENRTIPPEDVCYKPWFDSEEPLRQSMAMRAAASGLLGQKVRLRYIYPEHYRISLGVPPDGRPARHIF
jgi:hypothetical protein